MIPISLNPWKAGKRKHKKNYGIINYRIKNLLIQITVKTQVIIIMIKNFSFCLKKALSQKIDYASIELIL